MNKCPNCNVTVYSNHSYCPLCQTYVQEKSESSKQYATYEYQEVQTKLLQRRIVRVLLALAPILVILVNVLTYEYLPYMWSVIVIFGSLYSALFLGNTLNPNRPLGGRIILNYLLLFVWCLLIELTLDFQGWSLEYILPLSSVVASIVCVVDLFRHRHMYDDLVVYILLMILIDLVPSLILIFRRTYVVWPTILSFIVSLIMILMMLLYNRNKFKTEIKKRTHS